MKKIILMFLILLAGCVLISCSEAKIEVTPSLEQVKSICELSTLECHYNNVAKMTIKPGKGIKHWGEKERELWIEYEGYAKLGIEFNNLEMTVNNNKITIKLPETKILESGILNINEDSYFISEDGWFNKNKIDTEKQQEAVTNAQKKMIKSIENNSLLFEKAEKKATNLIENYINKLGETSDVKYEIKWITEASTKESANEKK